MVKNTWLGKMLTPKVGVTEGDSIEDWKKALPIFPKLNERYDPKTRTIIRNAERPDKYRK